MKATERYCPVVLFILLYMAHAGSNFSVCAGMTRNKQYFYSVMLFILYLTCGYVSTLFRLSHPRKTPVVTTSSPPQIHMIKKDDRKAREIDNKSFLPYQSRTKDI